MQTNGGIPNVFPRLSVVFLERIPYSMENQISFTYLPCQSCSAKIHCDQCSDLVAASLINMQGVASAAVDMVKKQLTVSGTMDLDELEERLEDLGVFTM